MKIDFRGGNHPTVNRNDFVRSEAFDFPLLQCTQQLDLKTKRHVLDLVEKERSTMSVLEFSYALAFCTREGARLVTKNLTLEQGFGQATSVNRNQTSMAPAAEIVKAARN
jgi:hypothetical protein